MSTRRPSPPPAVPDEESLTCEVLTEADAARVCPSGTLDLATAPQLEQELERLRDAGIRRLTVDLRGLVFMDSSGLRLVLRWTDAGRADGFTVGFLPGPPAVQRVFEVTGTVEHVAFLDP